MYQISNFSLTKLNNAEFVAYCVNLANQIERCESAKLGLEPALMTSFATLKQKLIDQVYNATTSPYTLTMKTADVKRGKIYKRIQLKMQIVCQAEDGSQLLHFKDDLESIILSKYSMAVTALPQQEESAVIQGFIHDLRSAFSEDDLDDMDLSNDISNLESANQEFIAAYSNRNDERASSDTGVTLKLRSQMNEVIAQIYFSVQYLANSTLEANAQKAETCQSFIASVNVMLADTRKRWRQRTSGMVEVDENGEQGGDGQTGGSGDGTGGNGGQTGGSTGSDGGQTGGTGGNGAGGSDANGGQTGGTGTGGSANNNGGNVHDGTVEF